MAKITVDGREIEIPKLKLKQLKIVWPKLRDSFQKMQEAKKSGDKVDGVTMLFASTEDALFVICTALHRLPPPSETLKLDDGTELKHYSPAWFDEQLDPTEVQQLPRVINDIMIETGLFKMGKPDPEAMKALEDSLSTGTGMPSSPNSSQQDARAEAGAG